MKISNALRIIASLAALALFNQGCQTVPAEEPENDPAPVTRAGTSVGTIELDSLTMVKSVSDFATVGEEFEYIYEITPKTAIQDVQLTDKVPEGLTYISSSPPAFVEGDTLTWQFPQLDQGQRQVVRLRLRADETGTYRNCATITAVPVACTVVNVGRASLSLVKTVDKPMIKVGETANFSITVRNTGNAAAKNVVVTDTIPAGLSDAQGRRSVSFPIAELPAGASRTFDLPLTGAGSGESCNVATVSASNVVKDDNDSDDACVTIVQPRLEVEKTGTEKQFAGKRAEYEITVRNVGTSALRNVVVTDNLPAEYRVISAGGGNVSGNTITWNIPSLAPEGEMVYNVVVTTATAGSYCNGVTASVPDDNISESAQACTLWTGYPALLLEVIDTIDPLLVGDRTEYVIRVTNQGTANDFNIKVRATYPGQVVPVAASGATAETLQGNVVDFAPYGVLKPKEVIEFRVTGQAAELGDNRVLVELSSDLLTEPVIERESTQVY